MSQQQSFTAIVPVMNETHSFITTCDILMSDCADLLREIIVVSSPRTTDSSMTAIETVKRKYYQRISHFVQSRPFVGGAYQDAFEKVKTSHFVMLSSDLETDPYDVRKMIEASLKEPTAIIATTRWRGSGKFEGYNPTKLVLNFLFQKFFSLLYFTSLSDMTYGFRLYPTAVMNSIVWENLKHPFFFETLLKPLRLGVPTRELPSSWKARVEGESQNPFFANFIYAWIGLKIRFSKVSLKKAT
jgi:hypothetical protein